MAKKQEQQPEQPQMQPEQHTEVQQATQGMVGQPTQQNQAPAYRYNENMIDWESLKKWVSPKRCWNSREYWTAC